MSQRILARRLDGLGTSFGQILDGVRHQLALRYLGEADARASQCLTSATVGQIEVIA